jgi:predicted MFS family arabinose efflux permease
MAPLLGRFGPAPLTAVAFTCLIIAYAVFLRAGVRPDYPAVMLPATLLIGLAFGLGFSSLSVAATAGVPDAEQGLAASLFQTSFQVGGAVVLAVVTAVIDASGAGRVLPPAATLAAYRPALILITGVAAAGTLVALSGLRRRRDLVAAPPPRRSPRTPLPRASSIGPASDPHAARAGVRPTGGRR